MKKLSEKWFTKQAISIRRELACKARKKKKSNDFKQSKSIVFPHALTFHDASSRRILINAINKIRYNQDANSEEPLYFDFNKVGLLIAPATIYFSHVLEQFPQRKILSRASNKSNIVRAMFTKLGIHERLGLEACYSNHDMVDWYTFSGTDLTFGSDYDEIEKVLAEKLDEETFLVVNDAISEAVSNVLNHAYETHQRALGWKVSLRVTEEYLSLAITDLGKSIPVTVPDRIDDHMINRLSNVFNTSNFLGMNDAQLIDIASEFRRSNTEERHRGKGFGDMLEVCKKVQNSELIVYSRKGIWVSNGQKCQKMVNYKDKIDGTIIFWKLPLTSPLTLQGSGSIELGDGHD
ncbi:ATP-binding protein [Acinetobacter sp. ANC 5502]